MKDLKKELQKLNKEFQKLTEQIKRLDDEERLLHIERFNAKEKLDRLLRTTVDVSHRMNREQKNKGLIGRLLG